jgi:hypothetical protein
MTMRRRTAAVTCTALIGLMGVACGSSDASKSTDTSLVRPGQQQGSGSDGSVVNDPPGNTPGGNDAGDQPTGSESGQNTP